jgi:predicted nicotinamide N-methyase
LKPAAFIQANLRLEPVPTLPDIVLYAAHAGSRLSRLLGEAGEAPYWAFPWAGGLALAQYFRANPQSIAGKRVLDLGAGSGLVGIVAARLGADVAAAEIDPFGKAAIGLNASANGVRIMLSEVDIEAPAPAGFDLIAGGDIFYREDVARRMLPFLQRCAASGVQVLVGDPGRRDLPIGQLEPLSSYAVSDVGDRRDSTMRTGTVYRLKAT